MDDCAAYLISEAISYVACLHQFSILQNSHEKTFHLFFEGEEGSLFYMAEFRKLAGSPSIHAYDCGGKRNIISVRDQIDIDDQQLAIYLFLLIEILMIILIGR
jgi:hypothetical protein